MRPKHQTALTLWKTLNCVCTSLMLIHLFNTGVKNPLSTGMLKRHNYLFKAKGRILANLRLSLKLYPREMVEIYFQYLHRTIPLPSPFSMKNTNEEQQRRRKNLNILYSTSDNFFTRVIHEVISTYDIILEVNESNLSYLNLSRCSRTKDGSSINFLYYQ